MTRTLLRILVTAGLLTAIFTFVDVHAVVAVLRAARPGPLIGALALFLVTCGVSSMTWLLMLRPLGCTVSFPNAFGLNLIGFFINNFVPAGIGGDVWRTWIYAQQSQNGEGGTGRGEQRAGLGASAASVLAERFASFTAIVLLAWMVVPLAAARFGTVQLELGAGRRMAAPTAIIVMNLALSAVVIAVLFSFRPLAERLRAWFIRRYASRQVDAFIASLLVYRQAPGRYAAITGFAVLSPLIESFAHWMLGLALGLDIGPLAFIVLTPVLRVTHHFPLTMNGAGVQDAAMVWIMAALGVGAAQGLALSLLIHGVKMAVSALGLPLWAWMSWRRRNSPPSV